MKKIILLGLCAIVTLPHFVHAGPILRSGERVSVDASQTLKGDFYGLGSTINISGEALYDVNVVGGKVNVNSPVGQDLSVLGGTVQINGDVADDLRIVGGDVTLSSHVGGDVVVFGGTFTILSDASVEGDVLFFGNDLIIEGDVAGSIHGMSESVRIDSYVGGDIEYTSNREFILGDNADIAGSIAYKGSAEVVRAQGAVVAGEIHRTEGKGTNSSNLLQSNFVVALSILFSTYALFFIGRKVVALLVEKSNAHIGLYGLVGLSTLLVAPIVAVVLMVSVVGGTIGFLLLIGYILLLVSSFVLAIILMGHFLQKYLLKASKHPLMTPILGSALFVILMHLPVIGGFIIFAVCMVSFGILIHTMYHALKD